MFRPKLPDTLKGYTRQQFTKDLMAGLIVGVVALPLAIAFAIASGVSPEKISKSFISLIKKLISVACWQGTHISKIAFLTLIDLTYIPHSGIILSF